MTVPLVLIACLTLVVLSPTPIARLATAIFTLSSMVLFGMSALYHRFNWGPKAKATLRRIDHASIFVLIAGTYTPLALLALEQPGSIILLSSVWGGALVGILARIFWVGAPRWLYVPLYLLLGWAAIAYMGPLFQFSVPMAMLVIIGGLAYTVGAIVYGFKRPNFWPGHFGFHELFHALTVVAWACHFAAVMIVALRS